MHAIIVEQGRLLEPVSRAPRRSWRRRWARSHLRRFGRGFVARVTESWIGLINALYESRSRSAARVINRHRHLVADGYRANQANLEGATVRPGAAMTAMPWRLCFLLAALMIVFAIAHHIRVAKAERRAGRQAGRDRQAGRLACSPDARRNCATAAVQRCAARRIHDRNRIAAAAAVPAGPRRRSVPDNALAAR